MADMSNPLTLQELADSLAAIAEQCRQQAEQASKDGNSLGAVSLYARREAHLDVRATVLAMIGAGREVVRTVHEYPAPAHEVIILHPEGGQS